MGTRTRTLMAAAGAAALSLGLVGVAGPASADGPAQGSLVMIGGNLQEDAEILQRIVDLAEAADDGDPATRPTIALITAAAKPAANAKDATDAGLNNAAANGLYYGDLFAQYGADTYAVPIDTAVNYAQDPYRPSNAHLKRIAAQVAEADGVFFGGGDQMRYVRTLFTCNGARDEAFTRCKDTAVMSAVRTVLERGGVVAGVSAGTTIQQGADMVTGGESYEGWRDGSQPGYLDDPTELAYLPYGGFDFFSAGLVDSHFSTWGRQARMIRLALDTGHDRVFGVDETTALVVDRTANTGEVIGRHGVSVLDVGAARVTGEDDWDVTGVRWTYLVAGDRIDLDDRAVTEGGAPVARSGAGPAPAADVWDSIANPDAGVYTLRDLARSLVSSAATTAAGTTYEVAPEFTTTVRADTSTRAWDGKGGAGTGFEGLEVTIAPTTTP